MVKWDTITHDFPGSSIDGTFWPGSYGTAITVASNRAAWPSGANYSGRATQGYDLIGSALLIQYQPVATGGYSGSHLKADASNVDIAEFTWSSSSGDLFAQVTGSNWGGSDSSNSVAVSAGSDVWIRYREASGTLYLDYSTDGISWTTLHSASTTGSMATALADCKLQIECGPFGSSITSGPGFKSLNLPPASGSDVEGTASASWPGWSATASGTVGVEGDASATWPSWSASAVGTVGVEGVAAASWPAWSATAAGDVAHDGQATATWPSWAATAQGDVAVDGQATATWPSWSGTAAGEVAHDGQATASWPGWSATASGTVGVEGTASTAWPSWTASAQGEVDVTGQATASWPTWVGTATGSGQGAGEGTATASWPGWSATAAGEVAHDGTASASWPTWSSTAAGVTGKAGTATAAWPSWTATSTGVRGVEGTASAAWPTWDGSIVITPPAAISRPYRVALDTSGHVQVAHDRRSRVSAAIDTSLRPSLELNP